MSDVIDLVILDIMLPGISGLKVCEELRRNSNVPILFLTAKSQESDKTVGLMAGGKNKRNRTSVPQQDCTARRTCRRDRHRYPKHPEHDEKDEWGMPVRI